MTICGCVSSITLSKSSTLTNRTCKVHITLRVSNNGYAMYTTSQLLRASERAASFIGRSEARSYSAFVTEDAARAVMQMRRPDQHEKHRCKIMMLYCCSSNLATDKGVVHWGSCAPAHSSPELALAASCCKTEKATVYTFQALVQSKSCNKTSSAYAVLTLQQSVGQGLQITAGFHVAVLGRLSSISKTVLFCNPELTMQREVHESVGGSSRAIAALQRVVDAGHGGVLLYGPTGSGKTLLATAAAQCSGRRHFVLHCSSVFRRNRGEAEVRSGLQSAISNHAYLQQFLHEAKLAAPSVVLLDQIDLLSAPRHKAAGITELQVASVLLETLDDWHRGCQEASDRTAVLGVVVIATSLSMTALDPSLLLRGRLEVRLSCIRIEISSISVRFLVVHIPLTAPSVEERLAILQIHAKSIPLETTAAATAAGSSGDEVSRTALLTQVASRCHGYVGSDLKHLCTEAATRAAVEQAECVTADHFYSAIANGRPAALTTQAIGAAHRPTVKLSDVQGCETQVFTAALLIV
eukprot:18445-Heterococcus_DN1.PRE.2